MLNFPEGIGPALSDSFDLVALQRTAKVTAPDVFAHFKPFHDCNNFFKALLVNRAQDLLHQLKKAVRIQLK